MSEELQGLIDKINTEGLRKAEAEKARIIAQAEAQAAAIVAAAKAEESAAKARIEAEGAAERARTEATLKQAARDTVSQVQKAVGDLLTGLLVRNVQGALKEAAGPFALAAVKELLETGDVSVKAGTDLAAALKSQLAAEKHLTVITDETFGTGFSVTCDGGRVEHAFTAEVVAEALAKRVRPELAKLFK